MNSKMLHIKQWLRERIVKGEQGLVSGVLVSVVVVGVGVSVGPNLLEQYAKAHPSPAVDTVLAIWRDPIGAIEGHTWGQLSQLMDAQNGELNVEMGRYQQALDGMRAQTPAMPTTP